MESVDEDATVVNIGNDGDVAKAMGEDVDPTENWDLSKVWVYTDPDGVKVPVPIGWTASGAESERYVNHNVTKTGTLSNLTFTPREKTWEHDDSDTDKAWLLNTDNVWVSQNYHLDSSEAELVTNEFTIGEGRRLFKYRVECKFICWI